MSLGESDAAWNRSDDGTRPLDHRYRRRTLRRLRGEPVHLADLAGEIAREHPGDPEPERVYVELYHVHVPKLEDAGLVAFDPDEKTVVVHGE